MSVRSTQSSGFRLRLFGRKRFSIWKQNNCFNYKMICNQFADKIIGKTEAPINGFCYQLFSIKYLKKGLLSRHRLRNFSSLYIYLKSFLQPTKTIGVFGQKRLISGYQITLQFRNDIGLATEKHNSTTSDLNPSH